MSQEFNLSISSPISTDNLECVAKFCFTPVFTFHKAQSTEQKSFKAASRAFEFLQGLFFINLISKTRPKVCLFCDSFFFITLTIRQIAGSDAYKRYIFQHFVLIFVYQRYNLLQTAKSTPSYEYFERYGSHRLRPFPA